MSLFFVFFFFFQAEDGIRDFHVTGVQTCALPIFTDFRGGDAGKRSAGGEADSGGGGADSPGASDAAKPAADAPAAGASARSEERRVGKEGRSRGERDP